MQYLLVENKQIIHLGPVFWRHRFIQSELDDLEVEYQVSPADPCGYLKITDSLEIFPIESITQPSHDPIYEQLVGPMWTFTDNTATGTYTTVSKDLDIVKSILKDQAASERYKKEVAGTTAVIQDCEVFIDTSRDGRNIFVQKHAMMNDTDIVQWKFPNCWLALSKADLGAIVAAGAAYIETQFIWEQTIVNQINAATTAEQLKSIIIIEPAAIPGAA